MSGDGCWPRQTGQMLLCVLSCALQWHFSVPDDAPEGLSPYLQQRDGKRLLSPSLANHWGDLHVLLDAVPGFPSGIVNPLPLLHGQRELLRSFWSRPHLLPHCVFTCRVSTSHGLPLHVTHNNVIKITMSKCKSTRPACTPPSCPS